MEGPRDAGVGAPPPDDPGEARRRSAAALAAGPFKNDPLYDPDRVTSQDMYEPVHEEHAEQQGGSSHARSTGTMVGLGMRGVGFLVGKDSSRRFYELPPEISRRRSLKGPSSIIVSSNDAQAVHPITQKFLSAPVEESYDRFRRMAHKHDLERGALGSSTHPTSPPTPGEEVWRG